MALRVAVYTTVRQRRSTVVGLAMAEGIRKHGGSVVMYDQKQYVRPEHDIAVFYGFEDNLPRILQEYRAVGRPVVVIDLGYWERKNERTGRFGGYHKISVNDRHPTAYFDKKPRPPRRFASLNVEVKAWQPPGDHILIAGMSDRAAAAEGFVAEEWERAAIKRLRIHTIRPLVYRPKPSWKLARPIENVGYSPATQTLEQALQNCFAVVTHHSNVAVDGLLSGIPAFVEKGVAAPMAETEFGFICSPKRPFGREQWAANIAWTQWSTSEMGEGLPWAHLREEGLIP